MRNSTALGNWWRINPRASFDSMKIKQAILLHLLLFALSLLVLTQNVPNDSEVAILKREKAWQKALLTASDDLENLYSKNLSYHDWNGTTHARATLISDVKSGRLKYQTMKARAEAVQVYLNTAIYTCEMEIEGTYGETSISRVAKILHVWVKEAETWRLLVHQTQKVSPQIS